MNVFWTLQRGIWQYLLFALLTQNLPSHLLNLFAVAAVVESMVASFFERRALAVAVIAVAAWQVRLINLFMHSFQ